MWNFPNRYICSVIEEMRDATKALNHFTLFRYKKYMSLLIEEAQTHANNMEAGLSDLSDLRDMRDKKKELKDEITSLKKAKAKLDVDQDSSPHKDVIIKTAEDLL